MGTAKPCAVLVVDDDQDIRESIVEILEEHGCKSMGARNGREALRALRDEGFRPCLIILDLMMPVMDGLSFRAEQQNDPALRDIPVVIITAYHDGEARARAVTAAGMLRKPIRFQTLLDTVEALCE